MPCRSHGLLILLLLVLLSVVGEKTRADEPLKTWPKPVRSIPLGTFWHPYAPEGLAISADRKWAVTWFSQDTWQASHRQAPLLYLWDLTAGKLKRQWHPYTLRAPKAKTSYLHLAGPDAVVLSPDGKWAYLAPMQGAVLRLSLTAEKTELVEMGATVPDSMSRGLVLSPMGDRLAAWADNQLTVIDLKTNKSTTAKDFDDDFSINQSVFSKDGKHLFVSNNERVEWRDGNTGKGHGRLEKWGTSKKPPRLAYDHQHDRLMVTASDRKQGMAWSLKTGTPVKSTAFEVSNVTGLAVGAKAGPMVLREGIKLCTRDRQTGEVLKTLLDLCPQGQLRLSNDGKTLVVLAGQQLLLWNFELPKPRFEAPARLFARLDDWKFINNSRQLAVADNTRAMLYSVDADGKDHELRSPILLADSSDLRDRGYLAWSKSRRELFHASAAINLRRWKFTTDLSKMPQAKTLRPVFPFLMHGHADGESFSDIECSPDGKKLVSATMKNMLLWNLDREQVEDATNKIKWTITDLIWVPTDILWEIDWLYHCQFWTMKVNFRQDSDRVAHSISQPQADLAQSAKRYTETKLWNDLIYINHFHCTSADARWYAARSDKVICVYETMTGLRSATIESKINKILHFGLSAHGRWLFVVTHLGKVEMYDLWGDSTKPAWSRWMTTPIQEILFSPDGQYLALMQGNQINVYKLSELHPKGLLKKNDLSDEEFNKAWDQLKKPMPDGGLKGFSRLALASPKVVEKIDARCRAFEKELDQAELKKQIALLDSPMLRTRVTAQQWLDRQGDLLMDLDQKSKELFASTEAKVRWKEIQERWRKPIFLRQPNLVQFGRAMALLEIIGTKEAKKVQWRMRRQARSQLLRDLSGVYEESEKVK